jgi:hypothetical protein
LCALVTYRLETGDMEVPVEETHAELLDEQMSVELESRKRERAHEMDPGKLFFQ